MKVRLWVCDKCGLVTRRYASGPQAVHGRMHCGKPMRAARAWPSPEWYKSFQKKHEQRLAEQALQRKKFDRVWNSEGRILQVSTETRRAWRDVEALSKGGTFFIKRATIFLKCMRKDLGKFGSQGTPRVCFEELGYSTLGMYSRSLLRGVWDIKLLPNRSLQEIRQTFLHETLHWIDDQASSHYRVGQTPSDHFEFEARLADLKKRLDAKC